MRRFWTAVLAAVMVLALAGCGVRPAAKDAGKLQVVCTLFPYYDFVRQIGGEDVTPVLLIPAGRETHSFEPTPVDVITMSRRERDVGGGHFRRGGRGHSLPAEDDGPGGRVRGGIFRGDAGRGGA